MKLLWSLPIVVLLGLYAPALAQSEPATKTGRTSVQIGAHGSNEQAEKTETPELAEKTETPELAEATESSDSEQGSWTPERIRQATQRILSVGIWVFLTVMIWVYVLIPFFQSLIPGGRPHHGYQQHPGWNHAHHYPPHGWQR